MKDLIKVDSSQIIRMFNDMNVRLKSNVIRNAIRQSIHIIKKQAIDNLSNVTSNFEGSDKWGNKLVNGFKEKLRKDLSGGSLNIMGKKAFILRLFETGTKIRQQNRWKHFSLRKKRNTGRMLPTNFFSNAEKQSKPIVDNTMKSIIERQIIKINQKYK